VGGTEETRGAAAERINYCFGGERTTRERANDGGVVSWC
jgi:hypothetical protein